MHMENTDINVFAHANAQIKKKNEIDDLRVLTCNRDSLIKDNAGFYKFIDKIYIWKWREDGTSQRQQD